MQHFLDKKGNLPYSPNREDKNEVIEHSRRMIIKMLNSKKTDGDRFGMWAHVRWLKSGIVGVFQDATTDEKFKDVDDNLFYAYGGADVQISEAKITNKSSIVRRQSLSKDLTSLNRDLERIHPRLGQLCPSPELWSYFTQYDAAVDITITDKWDFKDTGPLGLRTARILRDDADAYDAAHYLQTKHQPKYGVFEHSLTFQTDYKSALRYRYSEIR